MKKLLILTLAGLGLVLGSCRRSGNAIYELTRGDSILLNRVLQIYDSHVRSVTGDSLPIDRAYRKMLAMVADEGDWSITSVDRKTEFDFNYDLLSGNLHNNLIYSRYYYQQDTGYADWEIHYADGMWNFMRSVFVSKPQWYDICDGYIAAGAFSPTGYSRVIYGNGFIDFTRERERFLVAFMFLHHHPIESFILKMDIEGNREAMEKDRHIKEWTSFTYDYDYKRTN